MARYHISRMAKWDLTKIKGYISRDNPRAAEDLLNRMEEKFRLLSTMPGIGRRRPEFRPDYRSLAEGNYVIFYRAVEDGIEIARVLHGRRDLDAIFSQRRRSGPSTE